ncbi:hypothetical protein C5167_048587 [Papaver somniferum]|uniref:K-box domain-containing protein n=1 Tax=Papaver somniferum TaxID=3469 RepID=A0A4Y7KJR5_PAPSO|nr:hypothetical protein C5167_048587 [Papaver somniferum]
MNRTLERYQHCCYTPQDSSTAERETQSWYQEVSKLKAKYESLQRSQRHLLGEDLGPLSVKELQSLEKQLEGALAQARQRKTQIMMEQMEELRRKLETEGQGSLRAIQASWESSAMVANNNYSVHPSQSNSMDCEPTLQIGYHNYVQQHQQQQQEEANLARNVGNSSENNFIQGWAL